MLTDLFIKRPVLAISINLVILFGGIFALLNVSIRQYPRSDSAVVIVKTPYVGASAELIRGFITSPMERVISSADGIDYIESASEQNFSTITAHLRLNFDQNVALTQIQSKVNEVKSELPDAAEDPIITVESADNRFAAMYLSFYSDEMSPEDITDYLSRVVQPQLSALKGVQKAEILGARKFAVRIWLKPEEMAGYGISASDVTKLIQANNSQIPAGMTKGSMVQVAINPDSTLKTREQFENLILKRGTFGDVRLKDISEVVFGSESYEDDVRFGGKKATFMGVWALANANSLDVITGVRGQIPLIREALPRGLLVDIPYDSTDYIRNAIKEVTKTLFETVLIVVGVIFLFIGSLRSTLVPLVAIPLSLLGGVGIMFLSGFTLNLLTLLAIVLAVGIVVDDAIVMLENVDRLVKEGMSPKDAAIKGARELSLPTIAMTITLAAVYTPIGLQGGLTGALFREFAFTLAGAVLISGFVALTLSPTMSAFLVRKSQGRLEHFIENVLEKTSIWYERTLRKLMNIRALILTVALFMILIIPVLFMFSMRELAPREDQGVVFGIVQAAPNSSLDQTAIYATEIEKIFRSTPEHLNTFQLTNPTGGFSGMIAKSWKERKRTTQEISGALWGAMSALPGVRVIVTTPPPLPGGGDFPVELVILSTAEPDQIVQYAQRLVGKAFQSGRFMFADTDLQFDLPEAELKFDRPLLASMNGTVGQVGGDLALMNSGNYISRFEYEGKSYKIIPQVKRSERLNPKDMLDLNLGGVLGNNPLSAVATMEEVTKPRKLNRFQQLNSAKIYGAPTPGTSIDEALAVLEDEAAKILPADYRLDYAGESRQLRNEDKSATIVLLSSLLVIYLVLAAQFESFKDPLIVLLGSVPLAMAGALIFPFFGATSLNVYSQVGLVTLVGLVAKNGILLVEFANRQMDQGLDRVSAVIKAGRIRLRPILMTSVATVVGHAPLMFATGPGAGSRNSIGIILVSGMTIGTVLTLFVLPALYVVAKGKKGDLKKVAEDKMPTNNPKWEEKEIYSSM